jgi:hypothetical protein
MESIQSVLPTLHILLFYNTLAADSLADPKIETELTCCMCYQIYGLASSKPVLHPEIGNIP